MFEERNEEGKVLKSYRFSLFHGQPWVVKAYIYILVLLIASMILMGFIDAAFSTSVFKIVMDKMLEALKLVLGAVVGALTTAYEVAKKRKGAQNME